MCCIEENRELMANTPLTQARLTQALKILAD